MAKTKKNKLKLITNPKYSPLRIANFSLLFGIIGVLFLVFSSAAPIAGFYGSVEKDQLNRINYTRTSSGLSSLQHIECLNTVAENWTRYMALYDFPDGPDAGTEPDDIAHNPNLANEVSSQCGSSWSVIGENVGVGPDSGRIFDAYMASPPHKANIMDSRYTKVGLGGYWHTNGKLYNTQVFAKCIKCTGNWNINANYPSDPVAPSPPAEYTHYLKNANNQGSADIIFKYGVSTYRTMYCDWNGDGIDTVGMYDNGTWYIRNSNTAGSPDIVVSFGYAAAKPVCGDWDGNGTDTIGVYDAGNWMMRNSNTPGNPEIAFAYGYSAALPVVGDWDGNGTDTIGVYDAGNWMMRNSNTPGNPEIAFAYGYAAALPVVGDWDGNRTDTVGVYDAGNWNLRNSNTPGSPNIAFAYGAKGYIPVVGDWNSDRITSIGVVTK